MEKKYEYGYRLKELRKKSGVKKSMEELCHIFAKEYGLNVNKSMISRWERGETIPDNKHIVAYSKYFDIDINYLLGIVNEKRSLKDLVIDKDVALHKEITEFEDKNLLFEIVAKLKKHDIEYLKHLKEII